MTASRFASRRRWRAGLGALALAAGCGAPPAPNEEEPLRAVWVEQPGELLAADVTHRWRVQLTTHDGPLLSDGPAFVLRLLIRGAPAGADLSCVGGSCEQSARQAPVTFAATMPLGRYEVTACIMAGPEVPFGCAPEVAVEVVELGMQPLVPEEELTAGRAFTASGVLTADGAPFDRPLLAENVVVRFWSAAAGEVEEFPCATPAGPEQPCSGLTSDEGDNRVHIWPVRFADPGPHRMRTCLISWSEAACRASSFVDLEVLAATRGLRFVRQPAGAAAGQALAQQPLVEVVDLAGEPVAADGTIITVRPSHQALRMHLFAGEQATVAAGVATFADVAVGPTASEVTLVAQAANAADASSEPFDVTGTLPAVLQVVYGDGTTAPVGSAVVFTLRVLDAVSEPVEAVTVDLAITGGGGSVDPTATTDAAGIAYGVWTLGHGAGLNTLEASVAVPGVPPVTLHVSGQALAASQARKHLGDGQTASISTLVAVRPTVQVTDFYGNPVEGHNVRFATSGGGGTIEPEGVVDCDAEGLASVSWWVGPTPGENTLTATVTLSGFDTVLEFTAEAVP